jgi:hypothetical protein
MKKLIVGLVLGAVIASFMLTATDYVDLRNALAQTARPVAVYLTGQDGTPVAGGGGGGNALATGFYAVERSNITTSSVNLAFGITSRKVKLIASASNTADLCVDYAGGTAACPAANTAGHDRLKPGTSLVLDDFQTTSISIIAASGTQSLQVTAWQ